MVHLINGSLEPQKSVTSLETANALRPVLLRLSRLVRRESHELGVTAGQVTLLSKIEESPGITGRELADHERISAPGISAHLERLEAAGLIERVRASDRRRVGITVSAEGSRVLRSVRERRTAWLAGQLDGLSEADHLAIASAIEPLSRLIDEVQA